MPELIEVEQYRALAETVVGRRVRRAILPDAWFVKRAAPGDVVAVLRNATVVGARRRGKLLVLDLDGDRPGLGLRFGMTGRLLVDGRAAIERLEYSSSRDDPAWDRVVLEFVGGGRLVVRDPRRLGAVELDPDEAALGPDAASITSAALRRALAGATAPLKARLLDQSRVSGLGNLLVDEVLWRAALAPTRPAGELEADTVTRLARVIRTTVRLLSTRGGSHTGDLQEHRRPGSICPRDGEPLVRATVGGRTTYWCEAHQR